MVVGRESADAYISTGALAALAPRGWKQRAAGKGAPALKLTDGRVDMRAGRLDRVGSGVAVRTEVKPVGMAAAGVGCGRASETQDFAGHPDVL